MASTEGNPKGHWESQAICDLNEALLESGGSYWHDWLPFTPGWYSSPKAEEFTDRAAAILKEEFGDSRLFVLKDPRICRIAPFWLRVFDTVGIRPLVILPMRNPLEVAASLERRDGFDPALSHLLWLRHMLDAEVSTRGLPRFHCSYEQLTNGWSALVERAQNVLGLTWPALSQATAGKVDAFIADDLRHHREPVRNVLGNPMLSRWIRDSLKVFHRWAEQGENPEDFSLLDNIRDEFSAAGPAFAQLVSSGLRARERARDLERAEEETRGKLADTEGALAAERVRADEFSLATEVAHQELAEMQARTSNLESTLAQRQEEIEQAWAEAGLHKEASQALQQALDESVARGEATERKLAQREAELGAALERARAEKQAVEAMLEHTSEEKEAAERRLGDRFREIATLSRLLAERETLEKRSREQVDWLREAGSVLLNGSGTRKGRLLSFMPASFHYKRQKKLLKRKGLFNGEAYLAAHPDVAAEGADPLQHYLNHGIKENRRRD